MRKITAIIAALTMVVALSTAAYAADYNFASAQANKTISVIPGHEGLGTIYFYNISGDSITHVTLEVSQAPENWQVEIEPPVGDTRVEIGGNIVIVTENLYVEPSEVLVEKPDTSPKGTMYIPIPGQGYALAKIATISVKVPASEAIGTQQEIVIGGVARWLGQTGAAAISQARDFTFTVNVVSETTNAEEIIITETEAEPAATQSTTGEDDSQSTIGKWLPAIIAAIIVVLGAISILLIVRRRHGQ